MTNPSAAATDGAPLIFLVAGEPSGDVIGGRLMAALKAQTGGRVRFAGVGGEAMAAEGLDSLFPIAELSVMGLVEVLPHLPRLLRRLRQTADTAMAARPAAVVTIDSPGFTLRLARRLRRRGIASPLIHYVAPQVWAWRPGRARHLAREIDHLLTLLPFEPPLFEVHGLAATFVGHPAVEPSNGEPDGAAFRARHGIPADAPLVCILPGSRAGEVKRLLPVFGAALRRLAADRPGLRAAVPSITHLADDVTAQVRDWAVPTTVLAGPAEKAAAFAAADAALAASGTVAVELAVAGLPSVIAYRVSPVSAALARRLIRVDYVSLPNLVLGREVQPERLQERCTPKGLAEALAPLLEDGEARQRQLAGCREAARALGLGGTAPSERAADAVLSLIDAAEATDPFDRPRYNQRNAKEA